MHAVGLGAFVWVAFDLAFATFAVGSRSCEL